MAWYCIKKAKVSPLFADLPKGVVDLSVQGTQKVLPLSQEDGEELLKRGDALLKEGKFKEAEQCFRQAQEKVQEHFILLNGLGTLAYHRKAYKEAEKLLHRAITLNPEYAEGWNNLGAVYFAQGKFSDAKAAFSRALRLCPDLRDAQENLLHVYREVFKTPLPSLSLCMIARNEEANLLRVLSCVRGLVDEIVLVDTGSSDRTPEIAASFGARVYHFAWCDDFAAARNEALRYAQGEWILVLDADDEMERNDLLRLKAVLSVTDAMGFMLPIRSPLDPHGRNVMTNYLVRVFRNDSRIRFKRRIHETVEGVILSLGGKIYRLTTVSILHHGYKESGKVVEKISHRNSRILLEAFRENPKDSDILTYLGKAYLFQGKTRVARALFEKALKLSQGVGFFALTTYLDLAFMEEDIEKALAYLKRAEEMDPYLPDLWYVYGKVYQKAGRWEEALEAFEKVHTVDTRKSTSLMTFFRVDVVDLYLSLAQCAVMVGDREKAEHYSHKALAVAPNDPGVLNNLAVLLIQENRFDEAEEYLEKALEYSPKDGTILGNLLQLLVEKGDFDKAKAYLLRLRENLAAR
ncbi:tetratricopeptide repeat protein [Candidatus Caldatribacterium sp.]|uniref:tetratricopeptide repeat-containing glycosyltransferase family 2 protein n=1 Tax=Candidatus Caldatribacterium sp. TaxID=2282143 RepID=UPI002994210A|nr:tetratricopeptide repeat protein [Candidatus Caldatribacterium sp.]MDW8082127.1 tetratricopeptide repeat protein [Candidatus Calescibacterium sp.]